MGYYVHIRRAEGWAGSANSVITQDEWEKLVASDPELRLDSDSKHRFCASTASWVDPASGKERGWFGWSNGGIMTKSPDRPQLAKMLQIAERFGAQVEDDYGEKFTTPEAISEDPVKEWASERREWWWMFGSAMMCLCACIVFLAVGQFAVALFLGLSTGILSVACYFGGRIIFKS